MYFINDNLSVVKWEIICILLNMNCDDILTNNYDNHV